MKYYVVWPDGQKFGPADLETLNQWAAEGRIKPDTQLENADTGAQMPAASLEGLNLAQEPETPAGTGTSEPSQPTTGAGTTQGESSWSPVQEQQPSQPTSGAGYTPAGGSYQNPPTPQYGSGAAGGEAGKTEAIWAFVLSGLGLICCGIIAAIPAVVLAYNSKNKGSDLGNVAVIVAWIVLALNIIGLIAFFALGGLASLSA